MKLSQAPAQVINYSSPECLFLRRSQYWVCVYPKASLSLFGPLVAWACYFPLNSEMRCTQLKICIVFSHKLKRTLNKRGLDPLWLPVFPLCLSCSPCWFWPNASSWWLEQLYCSSWFFPTVDISGILTTKCRRGEISVPWSIWRYLILYCFGHRVFRLGSATHCWLNNKNKVGET